MPKNYLWTQLKARLQFIKTSAGADYHWLFLPGGPGLGSEYLTSLTQILQLPGTIWLVDFPGDGSNHTSDDERSFARWSEALLEVVATLENVILVAHSSGGMFTLATPGLEKFLTGLILMDSAPDASWQKFFAEYRQKHPVQKAEKLQAVYGENPCNETLKELTLACASYFSMPSNIAKTVNLFEKLPFNYKTFAWATQNFDDTYKAQWIPQNIPTLIFAGDQDHITPLNLFSQSADFQRDNIIIREIENAAHFPWLDNPDQVKLVFTEYCKWLQQRR